MVTEDELQREVERELRFRGLLWHHCRDARYCSGPAGLPDLIIAGGGGLLLPELKSDYGDMSAMQRQWMYTLQSQAGHPWRLWRPRHLDDGTIIDELETLR